MMPASRIVALPKVRELGGGHTGVLSRDEKAIEVAPDVDDGPDGRQEHTAQKEATIFLKGRRT